MSSPTCTDCGRHGNWTFKGGLEIQCDCGHRQLMTHKVRPMGFGEYVCIVAMLIVTCVVIGLGVMSWA